jgi:RHS repeat-associated protein
MDRIYICQIPISYVRQNVQQITYYDTGTSSWKTIPGSQNIGFNGGLPPFDFSFAPITTTGIIVYMDSTHPNWCSMISEIEVYGPEEDLKITAPASNSVFAYGLPVSFAAEAKGAVNNLQWTSSLDGALHSGGLTFNKADLTTGTHTVTISGISGTGKSLSDSIVIGVGAGVKSVQAQPKSLWMDPSGDSSGIIFRATTSAQADVTFTIRNANGVSVGTLGGSTKAVNGVQTVGVKWWGPENGVPLPVGAYSVNAAVGLSSATATFDVVLVSGNVVGKGRWLKGKDPTTGQASCDPKTGCESCFPWVTYLKDNGYFDLTNYMIQDPVGLVLGSFVKEETDLRLKSNQPLELVRVYNSLDHRVGSFGRGWSSGYLSRLEFHDNRVIFVNGDGSRVVFTTQDGQTYTALPGVQLRLCHDAATTFWTVKHPAGSEWSFDEQGKLFRMATACCGGGLLDAVLLEYDGVGRLSRVSNPRGQFLTFTTDADGRIIQVLDSSGRSVLYSYAPDGALLSYTDPAGRTTGYEYTDEGFLSRVTRPGSRITAVTYQDNRVTTVTMPDGTVSRFAWDFDNRTCRLTAPNGVMHEYLFDSGWRLIGYAVPTEGISKTMVADGIGALTLIRDTLGAEKSVTYTSDYLPQAVRDFAGYTLNFEYHPDFRKMTKCTDSLGRVWQKVYCIRGNVWSEIDPAGGVTSFTYDAHNNRTSKTDPLGRLQRWVYDPSGNYLIQSIDPEGGISSFSYDNRGNLVSSSDPLGRTTLFEFDILDRLTKTTYPDGRFTEMVYDEAGNVVTRRDNLGRETHYVFDLADRLTTLTRPDGTTFVYAYSADGKKISETDSLGRVTRFEYSPIGLLTKTIWADGSFETMNYDTESRLVSRTNELGQTTNLEYDAMGRLLCSVDPTGARWENQYDSAGRKIAEKDPLGRVSSYELDVLDRVMKATRPDNSFVTNSFDIVGNLLSTVDALGNQWSWVYDNLNRQVKAIQPNGASSTTTFDPSGQVIAETDALNRTTQYTFDNGGRRTATKDPLGNVWQNIYDNAGRLLATKDPLGAVSSLTYDIMDRVTSQSDALGNVNSFEFDAAGRRVAKTDAMGRRSITAYDLRNRPTSEVDPEGHTVSYGYNLASQRVSLTDGANRTWRWEHDSLGRVVAEFDPLGNANRSVFDSVGNRLSSTNARNQTTTYTFTEMNRLSQISYPDGTLATMAYDLEGREISRSGVSGTVTKTYDSVGNMTSEAFGPWGKKWQYSFDLVGNRIQAIDPEGQVFKYAVDKLNRVVSLNPPDRGDEITYSFDAAGRPIGESRPGVKTTNTFDAAGRLLEMKHERDHGREKIVASRKYTYSPVGNRLSMLNENNDLTQYFYNGSDWLTKVSYPDAQQVSYGYNGAGDRIEEKIETPTVKGHGRHKVIGTDTVVIPMTYDAGGRLISRASDTFIFDSDGNKITAVESGDESRYCWSPDNRLIKVEKDIECHRHGKRQCHHCPQTLTLSETYTYEPESWRRLTRKTDAVEMVSVYDGNDESGEYLVKETGHHHGWKCDKHKSCKCPQPKPEMKFELIRQFIGGPGTDDIVATRYHGRYLWHAKDSLGSTIALTNRGGHAVAKIGYDAFGNLKFPDKPGHGVKPCNDRDLPDWLDRLDFGRSFGFDFDSHHFGRHFGKVMTPYLYTGRRWDGFSQTYNHRNRQMNPKYGRFISRDPIGFRGGLNLWGYAKSNPLKYWDPWGLASLQAISAAIDYLNQSGNSNLIAMAARANADPTDCDTASLINAINQRLAMPILPGTEDTNLRAALNALNWPFPDSNPTATVIKGEDCAAQANKINNAIDGKVYVIDIPPEEKANGLWKYGMGDIVTDNGTLQGWDKHVVVIKDGVVYDRITGPKGQDIEKYKARFRDQPPLRFTPK